MIRLVSRLTITIFAIRSMMYRGFWCSRDQGHLQRRDTRPAGSPDPNGGLATAIEAFQRLYLGRVQCC
jgi:hypothetical protein